MIPLWSQRVLGHQWITNWSMIKKKTNTKSFSESKHLWMQTDAPSNVFSRLHTTRHFIMRSMARVIIFVARKQKRRNETKLKIIYNFDFKFNIETLSLCAVFLILQYNLTLFVLDWKLIRYISFSLPPKNHLMNINIDTEISSQYGT